MTADEEWRDGGRGQRGRECRRVSRRLAALRGAAGRSPGVESGGRGVSLRGGGASLDDPDPAEAGLPSDAGAAPARAVAARAPGSRAAGLPLPRAWRGGLPLVRGRGGL